MNKTSTEQLLFTIGLARKAGKVSVGTEMVCDDIRKKKVRLVIYAEDVSANTEKRICDCCTYYKVFCKKSAISKEMLGAAIGKSFAACIGITDENLSELIKRNL